MPDQQVWYVAYGSNMLPDRLNAYLVGSDDASPYGRHAAAIDTSPPLKQQSLWVKHSLYFAGSSARWQGGVAFLSLVQAPNAPICAVAYLISESQLHHVIASENGVKEVPWTFDSKTLQPGQWTPIPVLTQGRENRAKYNALIRLQDIDGAPAVTLTTWRHLDPAPPSLNYLDIFTAGVRESRLVDPARVDEYVRSLVNDSTSTPYQPIKPAFLANASPMRMVVSAQEGKSTGSPSLKIDKKFAEFTNSDVAPVLGFIATRSGRRIPTWVYASHDRDDAVLSAAVVESLHDDGAGTDEIDLNIPVPIHFRRISGRAGDIPEEDVIQLHPDDADLLGEWALVTSPQLSAPMKVERRYHVTRGSVRIAYASRLLLGLGDGGRIVCQPIGREPSKLTSRVGLAIHKSLEWALGAPPMCFRSTEGLVGDDGRAIVRVDQTAMDFLGLGSGDQVVVTWARRRTPARVLLHTELTRSWMEKQLTEATGSQYRDPTGTVESRIKSPEHLRVWVSSTVRSELEIPPDTVVRLRRSLPHLLAKNTALLAIPATGWFLSLIAKPNLSWQIALTFAVIAIGLIVIPLRMKDKKRRRSHAGKGVHSK